MPDCGHGWRCATDCDKCMLERVSPAAAQRITDLETALRSVIDMHTNRYACASERNLCVEQARCVLDETWPK